MDAIHKAKEYLVSAEAVLITAGAGMGVDSGLPDFRGRRVSGEHTLTLEGWVFVLKTLQIQLGLGLTRSLHGRFTGIG